MSFNFATNDDTSTNTTYSKVGTDFCKAYYQKMFEGMKQETKVSNGNTGMKRKQKYEKGNKSMKQENLGMF